jgi:hypothetical protein
VTSAYLNVSDAWSISVNPQQIGFNPHVIFDAFDCSPTQQGALPASTLEPQQLLHEDDASTLLPQFPLPASGARSIAEKRCISGFEKGSYPHRMKDSFSSPGLRLEPTK